MMSDPSKGRQMKILFGRRLTLLSVSAAALAVALPAAGQTAWPARPIRLIVPAAPGAQIDMLARTSARSCRQA